MNRLLSKFQFLVLLSVAAWLLAGCRSNLSRQVSSPYFAAPDAVNYHGLVSVFWLKSLMDYHETGFRTPRPPACGRKRLVVLEASWAKTGDAKDYLHGHIPGAIHFNTDDLESGYPRWRLLPCDKLQQVIGKAGITPDTTVVIYGSRMIAAARVWWVLKYAGVSDVRLLDGGVDTWRHAGYPVQTAIPIPHRQTFIAPPASHMLATTDYVRRHLGSRTWLADVRSRAEFDGHVSGYDYVDAKGRIPGAIHLGDGDDNSYLYRKRNGQLRPVEAIKALWRKQGIVSTMKAEFFDREVIFYCGGGWRSSVACFYAWLMGCNNVRNYSDGWCGWSTEYSLDDAAKGGTPGWRQERTDHPSVPEVK